ncbi:unnamed protein product [Chrysodeixis includens]|uniref:Aminopeptidase n=1 Tax=Chrysodeixis includens TaxID=689277 RepID=A0A894I3U5_CHRIL|nr:aminopeptidase N3 [Chrysodeixis includens]CAH0605716.1 unnamed protein product [Chrysodeixis includens]
MLVPTIFCILLGAISAVPQDDFRSNLEFADYGTNWVNNGYRLNTFVDPTEVFLDLDVYLKEFRFNGVVRINVDVTVNQLNQIVLHQNVVNVEGVNVVNAATNTPVPLQISDPFSVNSTVELLIINLENPIDIGKYAITVRYQGKINDNPVDRGFYAGYYWLNNVKRFYATTQFQPYHARKAFPCFDEPQFKSRFTISITRDNDLTPSFSNMDIARTDEIGNRVRETFHPTPIISVYLVAFHVSDFVSTDYTSTASRPFKIISRQGATNQHQYAAEIGLKITDALDDYFGIQYHEMGQGVVMKNDHIALPDFPSGAMENWGMVNYREAYLLYDEEHTNQNNKNFIASIMAHELGHKWFGNLVTCFWWSNLWLNESFASFFEYFAAHWADPTLELDDQFVVDYVHSALTSDASPGATPMNWETVEDNLSITAHFSTTSYAKGASVLRMMEHFLGDRTFRNGLRYYLRDNAYKIGTPENLYDALRQAAAEDFTFVRDYPGVNVGAVLDSWVQNPGAPVLKVDVNMESGVYTVSQSRYVISGSQPPNPTWHIPLTWTHGGAPNFSNLRPKDILTTPSKAIQGAAGHNWVIFNVAQSGLYRVNYDNHNWEMLGSYLKSANRQNIHKLNRAQIVNDLLFFIRSNDISKTLAFNIIDFLGSETDYYVWNGALTQLDWIRRRFEHIPQAHEAFSNYILSLMNTVINHLGYNEGANDSTSTILNRMQIMNYACNLGHAGCISDSLNKWNKFKNDNENVPKNLRRYVYCTGLREGNATDYDFLLGKYNTAENTADMVVILRALACTRDQTKVVHYLQESMNNERIRIHDRTNAWAYALQGNPENLETVLNFFYANFEEIRTKYGGEIRLNTCINSITAHLTSHDKIEEFHDFVFKHQLELEGSFSVGDAVGRSAHANLLWGNANAPEIVEFLNTKSGSPTIAASTILLLVASLVQMLR